MAVIHKFIYSTILNMLLPLGTLHQSCKRGPVAQPSRKLTNCALPSPESELAESSGVASGLTLAGQSSLVSFVILKS